MTRFRAKIAPVAPLAFLSSLAGSLAQPAGKLSITVTGARNNDGVVRCALFNSPAAFPKIGQEWRGVIAPNCVFRGVPAGTYAVAFFHAEHNETQLTTACSASRCRATACQIMPPAASARRISAPPHFGTTAATRCCKGR